MISGITRFGMTGLIAIAAAMDAPGVLPTGESAYINGKAYVRLNDWAKANDLQVRWVKRDEALELSNPETKLGLQIHSPEVDINGVAVRLLFPLVGRSDGVYVSKLDLQTTFQPILSPPKGRWGAKSASICLDPGHGGKDPGFRVGPNQEKKYTLLLAEELRDQLKRAGWKVFLTRSRDTFIELPERPEIADRKNANLFISLHFNAAEASPSTVQGAEVYCLTPAGAPSTNAGGEGGGEGSFNGNRFNDRNMFLAYQLQRALTLALGVKDRGVHRARFVVLCEATMPAVLIEAGFMSHPVEGKRILSADYRKQIAKAIVEGVKMYCQVVNQ